MSRGFLIGAGWGTLVAGFGLVFVSQVTEVAPARFETVPPAVAAANAPEAPQKPVETAEPEAEASAGTSAMPIDAPPVAEDMPDPSPDRPQDSAADLTGNDAASSGDAPIVSGQVDGAIAAAAPDAPDVGSITEQPGTDTQSAAVPDAQTAMAAPDAPAMSGSAPSAPATDMAAPTVVEGAGKLPENAATDAPPETDVSPPAPIQDGRAAEPAPPESTAEDAVPAAVAEATPSTEPEPVPAQEEPSAIVPETAGGTALRPTPGFDSKAVEGVKTGRLPSIGTVPTAVPAPEPAQEATPEVVLIDDPDAPAIERFAAPFENSDNKPLFAILLQDTGGPDIDREALADLPFPVSFVIDPAQPDAAMAAQIYRAKGKEVLMLATGIPAGANASDLAVSMEVTTAVLPEAVAIVDLEDGGFQGNRTLATQVLALVRDQGRGVMSWDKGLNAASQVARREGMRSAVIFRSLDNEGESTPLIRRYLDRAAFKAAQDGRVVVVGKTRPETVAALLEWAVEGRAATVALAPSTAVMTAQ